jgi:hypothetical protein
MLPCQHKQIARQNSWLAARSMPEDLDSLLITRRALSGLEGPPRRQDSADTSSSVGSESPLESSNSVGSDSESVAQSSIDEQEVQEHKRAAVQQAYLNGSLGFGFSAGGLVFPYYGEGVSCCCCGRAWILKALRFGALLKLVVS